MADPSVAGLTCARARDQLSALMRDALGEAEAEALREHLIDCDACGEALADFVAQETRHRGDALPPPFVPPLDAYKAFLRARRTRFGTLWVLVRDGLNAADESVREWARTRRETIREAMDAVLLRHPPQGDTSQFVTTEVVRSDATSTGQTVAFHLLESPHVTADGRFRVKLRATSAIGPTGIALCRIELAPGDIMSFSSVVQQAGAGAGEVEIDEGGVGTVPGDIPLERVTFFLVRGEPSRPAIG
jgi:hypothetical protein